MNENNANQNSVYGKGGASIATVKSHRNLTKIISNASNMAGKKLHSHLIKQIILEKER